MAIALVIVWTYRSYSNGAPSSIDVGSAAFATKAFHALISSRVDSAVMPIGMWLEPLCGVVRWCQEEFDSVTRKETIGNKKVHADSAAASVSVRVPQTPGDIAAFAALHVPSSIETILGEEEEEEEVQDEGPMAESPNTVDALQKRLSTVLATAAGFWADAVYRCLMGPSFAPEQRGALVTALFSEGLVPWLRGLSQSEWLQALAVKLFGSFTQRFAQCTLSSSSCGSMDSVNLWSTASLSSITHIQSSPKEVETESITEEVRLFHQLLPYMVTHAACLVAE